ncbi:MAG TPA: Mut7-C RNAse domain-containing protein [Geobacteraceae bacterium]
MADAMLGKLARWLRILGCDVEYFPEIDDTELVERALKSGRLILTRDILLTRRRKARENHFFVTGDHFRDQLRQVVEHFAIDPGGRFLTRCLRCNAVLEEMEREAAAGRVPPYVHATQREFRICPSCGRIYWQGTHRERMVKETEEMLGRRIP